MKQGTGPCWELGTGPLDISITAQNGFLAKIKNVQLWRFTAFCDRQYTSLPRRILYNILDENLETVPAFLLAERFTGRAGVPPAQMEDAKPSLVAGETPAPPGRPLRLKMRNLP